MERIQAPDGVAALMRELWEKHQRGETREGRNVFLVDLPPLTDEERKRLNQVEAPDAGLGTAEKGCD